MNNKIEEALNILIKLGMPREQQNERTALCLLALTNIKEYSEWKDAANPLIGITPMMDYARENFNKEYAPNSRETFRRFSIHQLVQAGIARYNPDNPSRPVNSPKAVYQISPEALKIIQCFKTDNFAELVSDFIENKGSLCEIYAKEREMSLIPVRIENNQILLSPGYHSELIKDIIEDMAPRFLHGAVLIYVGDTGDKWGYFNEDLSNKLKISVNEHGKMPDVIFYIPDKNWLILTESVTSHGPVDSKRLLELEKLFYVVDSYKIYITAFPNKQIMSKYSSQIAWETEVWIADNPTHMIHFNGNKFLGPYKK